MVAISHVQAIFRLVSVVALEAKHKQFKACSSCGGCQVKHKQFKGCKTGSCSVKHKQLEAFKYFISGIQQSTSSSRTYPCLPLITEQYYVQVCASSLGMDPKWTGLLAFISCGPTRDLQAASGFACIVTRSITTISFILPFLSTSLPSNPSNVSIPPMTLPNTVFFPSKCGAGA